MKKLKQGQTIYIVQYDIESRTFKMFSYFLYSKKQALPPEGEITTKMPITLMVKIVEYYTNCYYTHSRRKALTRLNRMRKHNEK